MPLDVSLDAIENDLRMAERGGQVAELAMARAQVRATLLAAQPADHQGRHEAAEAPTMAIPMAPIGPDVQVAQSADVDVFTVPTVASWDDRVTAAAMLLKIPNLDLVAALEHLGELTPGFAPVEPDLYAGEPEEDDVDADFFAEARKTRRKR